MYKHRIAALLSMAALASSGLALAKPVSHGHAGGVTTLGSTGSADASTWQWQGGEDADQSFTSVGVIQDGTEVPTAATPLTPIGADSAPQPLYSPSLYDKTATPGQAPGSFAALFRSASGGHLPEPSTWLLLLLGLGMIGFALRGLISANQRLARLKAVEEN